MAADCDLYFWFATWFRLCICARRIWVAQWIFVPALIGFNVGVEFGQLTVVLLAFVFLGYWFNKKDYYKSLIANQFLEPLV